MQKRAKRVRMNQAGFTLVELIIVIIILGILAALAIPQFTTSTTDAKEATLKANLAVLRNAINLYYHQHDSVYPGAVKEDGTGTATVAADNPNAFINQLTLYTDSTGKTSTTKGALFPLGPYLESMPDNPLSKVGDDTDSATVTADATTPVADATAFGWKFSHVTGEIIANNATYQAY